MDTPNNPNGVNAAPGDAARRVADAAQDVTDRAKQAAQQKIEAGAEKASSSLSDAANSLRRAADETSGEHAWMSALLQKGANGLESAATVVQGGDLQRGLDGIASFARREPALFLGVSLALGFAMARVGKTAIERNADDPTSNGVGNSNGYS
jgi:hypothetical protein